MQPPDVDPSEQKQIEAKGFRGFLESPDEAGLRWIRRKKDGSCFFLKENKCEIYDVRPSICRLEPFTIMDYDYERNRIELELNFPASCGCIGVSEDGGVLPVEVIAKAAQVIVKKILALTARDMDLSVSDKRVASEARARILRRTVELADLSVE